MINKYMNKCIFFYNEIYIYICIYISIMFCSVRKVLLK